MDDNPVVVSYDTNSNLWYISVRGQLKDVRWMAHIQQYLYSAKLHSSIRSGSLIPSDPFKEYADVLNPEWIKDSIAVVFVNRLDSWPPTQDTVIYVTHQSVRKNLE